MRGIQRIAVVWVSIAGLVNAPVLAAAMDERAAEGLPDAAAAPAAASDIFEVVLNSDGGFAGRIHVSWPTGKVEPAEAQLSFTNGEIQETASTDDTGHFHVAGLQPGDYVATAAIGQGSTDFGVRVIENYASADASDMFLEATLTPTEDMIVATEGLSPLDCGGCGECNDCLVQDEYLVEEAMCGTCCGDFGGGCCGGGGGGAGAGLLPLLGLAGLAGLAGLGGGGGDNPVVVSPTNP